MLNYANSAVLVLLISFLIAVAKPYKDEVIVYFKDRISSQSISGLSIKKINGKKAVIKLPKDKNMKEFLKDLKKRRDILYAVPNYIIKKQLLPNDPMYKDQWYLKKINIENAWDISTGSSTVYVAVLDTGVDYNHPDLKNNIWLNLGETTGIDSNKNGLDDGCENNTDDDGNGYVDDCYGFNAVSGKGSALDDDGHGTHVAGEIGAVGNNGNGIAGINWNIKIIPCKFLDSTGYGDLNSLLECLKYVKKLQDNGLNIVAVNASYGYNGSNQELNIDCNNVPDSEKCLMQSINALFTVAAGNGGNDLKGDNNDESITLPCNYSTVLNNVICVGATNSDDGKSSFSNYGAKSVNIFAPGGEITGSTNCDASQEILSTWKGGSYGCAVGTSQSAPIIAGTVALLKTANNSLSLDNIKRRILTTGNNLLSLTGYSTTCNRVNIYNALTDEKTPKICIDQHLNKDANGYYYDFGTEYVNTAKTISFNIKNSGSSTLNIGKISLQNQTVFNIISDNCSNKSLNTFESCSISIRMYSSSKGAKTDTLTIPTNTSLGEIKINLKTYNINPAGSSTSSGGGGCNFAPNNFNIYWLAILLIIALRRKLKK